MKVNRENREWRSNRMYESLHYTQEELDLRDQARAFVEEEIAPYMAEMDRENKYPWKQFKRLGEMGYIGIRFPTEYGGGGKTIVAETLVNEQVGRASIAMACARSVTSYVAHAINEYGTEEQKRKYLPKMFAGDWPAAECLTEAMGGSDAARIKTTARKDPDGNYILTGEKRFQASGGVAPVLLVYALTDTTVNPREGMSGFIVEKGWEGLHTARQFDTLGYRGLEVVSEMVFSRVKVPKENRLGKEGDGWPMIVSMLNGERTIICGAFIGSAQRCMEIAAKYSSERIAFHKPIRKWEAVSFKLADMAVTLESARLLNLQAGRMIDRGLDATKEAAMAKLVATEGAFEVIHNAMQIMGGIGYTTDYSIERHFRDARNGLFVAGSSEMMRLIIQRDTYKELLGP
ncbi:MAG: acyl-CoA dehydrogenase family protein [Deltaproteobacteria bacterium]|nr:acyl-CoA dehydrogenase family protein [Deltaproteobacteria bacterium]